MKLDVPMFRILPGAATQLNVPHRPPSTCSAPRAAANCDDASTPFWSGTTNVCGPTIFGSFLHLPSLYPDKDYIDRTNLHWIVGCLGRLYDDFPGGCFDAQTVSLNRF